jgi:hypothetical protein
MKILVTGNGKSGSWRIRGEQLGVAIGATVRPNANVPEIKLHDLTVCVKRVADGILANPSRRWVWDIVDAWPQPHGNNWTRDQAVSWLREAIRRNRPYAMVFPTTQMQQDADFDGPSLVLPHHAWPKYQRQSHPWGVKAIGYEGAEHYLGRWRPLLEAQCKARGWELVINGDLTRCQIGIALRDCTGYAPYAWKSNVKLANFQALGIPAIVSPQMSYREFGGGYMEAENRDDLYMAIDNCERWHPDDPPPTLDQVARTYKEWLWTVANT